MNNFDAVSVWPAIVRAYQGIRAEAERALKPHGIASLEEYDVLLELRRAARPLTHWEIEERTLLRQYQLSRLVDRLVRKGLAERTVSNDDGRARLITLTAKGRKVQKSAGNAYMAVLERKIAQRIGQDQANAVKSLLDRITAD